MTLHPITGRNTYCGPAAVAALTGRTTDEVAARIRRFRQRAGWHTRSVRGVWMSEMRPILLSYGILPTEIYRRRQTLQNLVRDLTNGVYLVSVTGHFVVMRVAGDRATVIDNQTKDGVPVTEHRSRRKFVTRCLRVARLKTKKGWA